MKIVFWVSNMWQDILKVQVLDTTTGLSTINEPMMEDKNCCELAREKFLEEQANYYDDKKYMDYVEELLGLTDCKTFREVLQDVKKRNQAPLLGGPYRKKPPKSSIPYLNTLRFWEECEK